MATVETYYYGQGRLYSRVVGVPGAAWRWWGDVSALTFGGTDETVVHKESYSGYKSSVRRFSIGGERTLSGTLHQIDADALAELLRGTVTTISGATISGEALPNPIAPGDVLRVANPYNISDVAITDSAGSPVTIDASHYVVDAPHGVIEFISLPSAPAPTQPLKVAYKHAGARQVSFFTAVPHYLELRYEGYNLAENNVPVIVEFYKVSTGVLQELALITNGNEVAGMDFEAEALLDGSKPAGGTLGQFGRYLQVNPLA